MNHIPVSKLPGKLYLGSVYALDDLQTNRIDYVVSLFPPLDYQQVSVEHDQYHISDTMQEQNLIKLNMCLNDINQKIFDRLSQNKNVLVHCFAGISRSATVVMDFLLTFEFKKESVEHVLAYVRGFRQHIHPNDGFIQLLQARHKRSISSSFS